MKIERALDWNQVSNDLKSQLNSVGYNPDLRKFYNNINLMVTELSKLEVSFRRTQKSEILDNKVEQINSAIDRLEKLVLMAKLMK
jgi:hypothetical protein